MKQNKVMETSANPNHFQDHAGDEVYDLCVLPEARNVASMWDSMTRIVPFKKRAKVLLPVRHTFIACCVVHILKRWNFTEV